MRVAETVIRRFRLSRLPFVSALFGPVARTGLLALFPVGVSLGIALWAQTQGSWGSLGVPTMGLTFPDLRGVTAAAECVRGDPTWSPATSDCDPFGRSYNYPAIWARVLAPLGVSEAHTDILGFGLALVFFFALWSLGVLALRGSRVIPTLVVLTLASVSPPVMLLLERGNVDSVVFALVVLALWMLQRWQGVPSALILASAAVLKVFPAGAFIALISPTRGRAWRVAFAAVVTTLGVGLFFDEYLHASRETPQSSGLSFGAAVPFLYGWNKLALPGSDWAPRLAGAIAFAGGLTLILLLVRRYYSCQAASSLREVAHSLVVSPLRLQMFLGGSGILLFAYLLGSNWDYRLVFATIPMAAVLSGAQQGSRGNLIGAAALLVLMWGSFALPAAYEASFDVVGMGIMLLVGTVTVQVLLPDLVDGEAAARTRSEG